jgi:hypothetical protein
MKKNIVVNSLKGLVYASTFAIGLSVWGGNAFAEELTKDTTNVEAQQVVSDSAKTIEVSKDAALTAAETKSSLTNNSEANLSNQQLANNNSETKAKEEVVKETVSDKTASKETETTPAVSDAPKETTVPKQTETAPVVPNVEKETTVSGTTTTPNQETKSNNKETKFSLIDIQLGGSLLKPILGDVDINVLGGKKLKMLQVQIFQAD